VTERQRFIGRVRGLARACAEGYVESRAALGFPLLSEPTRTRAVEAYRAAREEGVGPASRAAGRAIQDAQAEVPDAA
jgi:glycyl-tRNA synthetase alpha chain